MVALCAFVRTVDGTSWQMAVRGGDRTDEYVVTNRNRALHTTLRAKLDSVRT